MNNVVEPVARPLAQRGCALLVFTDKSFAGWSADDARKMDRTLASLAAIEGLDAARPIFALVGAKDTGAQVWRRAETAYAGAGIPLVLEYVEGKGL